jgi:molecular chaperone HtpG
MDGQLDVHMLNKLETQLKESRFVRVDSDVVEKLIQKEEVRESKLTPSEQDDLKDVFTVKTKTKDVFNVVCETMDENEIPVVITQSEFMRRMKEMAQMGGGMNFYGELPDSYNIVVNTNHKLIGEISKDIKAKLGSKLDENDKAKNKLKEEIDFMEKDHKKKKPEEVSQHEKDDLEKLRKELTEVEDVRKNILETYGSENKVVKQLIDLAMLATNMLRGEDLNTFVKRSVELL